MQGGESVQCCGRAGVTVHSTVQCSTFFHCHEIISDLKPEIPLSMFSKLALTDMRIHFFFWNRKSVGKPLSFRLFENVFGAGDISIKK